MIMPRRFIAGAVCPRCSAMDRIVMFSNQDGQFRECVSCGYSDRMADIPETPELETRVNQLAPPLPAGVTPLRFIDPGKPRQP